MNHGVDVLVHIDRAQRALVEAGDLPALKVLRDKASALIGYLRLQGATTATVHLACALKLRVERHLGELLKETVHAGNPQLLHDETIGKLPDRVISLPRLRQGGVILGECCG